MTTKPLLTVETLAAVIYGCNPALQPWDGDTFGYKEKHWAAEHKQKLARKQAEAIYALLTNQETETPSITPAEVLKSNTTTEEELIELAIVKVLSEWALTSHEPTTVEELSDYFFVQFPNFDDDSVDRVILRLMTENKIVSKNGYISLPRK